MRNLINKILILVPALYLVVMPAWLTSRSNAIICSGISINIVDSSDYNLVSEREILNLINSSGIRIVGREFKEISVADIEKRISKLRELRDAEVYTTADGSLNVYADQRNPIMRVIAGGGDYFVDDEGVVIRRRKLYTPRLQVVEGNIRITSQMLNGVSVLDTAVKNSILKDIYQLVRYTMDDAFWAAQIDQFYVDSKDEIDLIPRLGNHKIHLGSIENYEGKLRNLETFYREVLPEAGWNKYDLINLEFKDQIVCRKR
jgi:cell division protein FtsQ